MVESAGDINIPIHAPTDACRYTFGPANIHGSFYRIAVTKNGKRGYAYCIESCVNFKVASRIATTWRAARKLMREIAGVAK